jgi:PPP family 3-phenylpropionic acid transporter
MSSTRRLAAYYFAYFAYAGALVPYFTLFLAARGLGPAQIAVVMAMPQVARIFAPTLWGWLADRSGAGRAIVIGSGAVLVAGYAALYAVRGFGGIALVMLALSVLAAGALPIVEMATLSALGERSGRYGPIRLWGSVGFILGVLALGAWLDYHPPETVLDWILALACASLAVSLALPRFAAPPPAREPMRFSQALRRPEALALFGAAFCMTMAHGTMYTFFSIYLEAAGYAKSVIGALWTLGVLAEIGVFLWLPQLLRRFGLRALLLASFACAAVRFAAIGWGVGSLALLAGAQLLHAATFATHHAATVAAVHRLFPGVLAARGQALYSSLGFGLGGSAGVLLAGWTWEALGPVPSFAASALFGLLGGALVAWKFRV